MEVAKTFSIYIDQGGWMSTNVFLQWKSRQYNFNRGL